MRKLKTAESRFQSHISFAILTLALLGCGRETKVYTDPPTETEANDTITTDGRSVLPIGFYDQSVNSARADVALDGDGQNVALRLQTLPSTNVAGAFNGSGTGNRALLGLASYHSRPLSALAGLSFDAKSFAGSESISILLLVDLACDGSTPRILIADEASLGTGTSTGSNGYSRFEAGFSQSLWKVSGAALTDPSDSTVTLIPSSSDSGTGSLSDLLLRYPSACLKNSSSGDSGLPKNLPTAAILFSLGSETTTDFNGVFINRLTVGNDVYTDLE